MRKNSKKLNFKLCATSGTAKYLNSNGINCKKINKVREGSPHIVESLNEKNIELVINTTEGTKSVGDSYSLRRSALSKQNSLLHNFGCSKCLHTGY